MVDVIEMSEDSVDLIEEDEEYFSCVSEIEDIQLPIPIVGMKRKRKQRRSRRNKKKQKIELDNVQITEDTIPIVSVDVENKDITIMDGIDIQIEDIVNVDGTKNRKRRRRPKNNQEKESDNVEIKEDIIPIELEKEGCKNIQHTDDSKEQKGIIVNVDGNMRKRKRKSNPPPDVLKKYWHQRHRLFSLFDEGIQMDAEGWYSVTPESIAIHLAERCRCDVIIDAFCGVGGNTIQFAMTCSHVIAIDIDEKRIECAKNNARVYGVEDRIEFIVGNYFELMPYLKADVVFLSPPWGGPEYLNQKVFDIKKMGHLDGIQLFKDTAKITPNIAYFLPRNIDPNQLLELSEEPCELEGNYINSKLKTVTVYFGELVQ